jgi:hypothetical protein
VPGKGSVTETFYRYHVLTAVVKALHWKEPKVRGAQDQITLSTPGPVNPGWSLIREAENWGFATSRV